MHRYIHVLKPGIVLSNTIAAIGGYLFAGRIYYEATTLIGITIGTLLVVSSGCVANNYLDRKIDAKMSRTKGRELVVGSIKPLDALVYASFLWVIGITALGVITNNLTTLLGITGFFGYVFVYGYTKRKTYLGTAVGTVPGSVSIVAGYCAATNSLDVTAMMLFFVMAFWQMVHFYAIAIFRKNDYSRANIPVISVVKGSKTTIDHIKIYTWFYVLSIILLKTLTHLSTIAFVLLLLLSAWWLKTTITDSKKDYFARKIFNQSILVLLVFSAIIAFDGILR